MKKYYIIAIVAILIGVAGWAGYNYSQKNKEQIEETPKQEDETANWKTYRNDQYGFEIKYPENKDYDVSEIKPESKLGDSFLSHIDITKNDGSFVVEINILENTDNKDDKHSLQGEVMSWYGEATWPFNFPTDDAIIEEFSINNRLAIKSSYIARGEGTAADSAVQIFTLNSQYIYKIDYIGDIEEGDQILSTLKFIKN